MVEAGAGLGFAAVAGAVGCVDGFDGFDRLDGLDGLDRLDGLDGSDGFDAVAGFVCVHAGWASPKSSAESSVTSSPCQLGSNGVPINEAWDVVSADGFGRNLPEFESSMAPRAGP